jgi:hypothetical protein
LFPWLAGEVVIQRKKINSSLLETRKLLTRPGKVQPSQRVDHKRNIQSSIQDMVHLLPVHLYIQLSTGTYPVITDNLSDSICLPGRIWLRLISVHHLYTTNNSSARWPMDFP